MPEYEFFLFHKDLIQKMSLFELIYIWYSFYFGTVHEGKIGQFFNWPPFIWTQGIWKGEGTKLNLFPLAHFSVENLLIWQAKVEVCHKCTCCYTESVLPVLSPIKPGFVKREIKLFHDGHLKETRLGELNLFTPGKTTFVMKGYSVGT